MQNTTLKYFEKKVAEPSEKVLKMNMTSTFTKVKVDIFHSQMKSHITKQLLTSISVDIWIYLPLKVIFSPALRPR